MDCDSPVPCKGTSVLLMSTSIGEMAPLHTLMRRSALCQSHNVLTSSEYTTGKLGISGNDVGCSYRPICKHRDCSMLNSSIHPRQFMTQLGDRKLFARSGPPAMSRMCAMHRQAVDLQLGFRIGCPPTGRAPGLILDVFQDQANKDALLVFARHSPLQDA